MDKCIFCEIISREHRDDDVVYEDNKVIVMLDKDWEVAGHTLVIWKQHVKNASDLTEEEFVYFSRIYHKVETQLLSVLAKQKAMTTKTGFLVEHFHFHIFPIDIETTQAEALEILAKHTKYSATKEEKKALSERLRHSLNF
jgi:histidine triad (HIT) family protein